MWTKELDWDEPIDHELSSRAKTWFSELEDLQETSVPRCLEESKREKPVSVQTFVDASSEAYGAVSYLRSEYAHRCFVVRIIASKTMVKLQVGKDTIVRPISKCVPLESNRQNEEPLN